MEHKLFIPYVYHPLFMNGNVPEDIFLKLHGDEFENVRIEMGNIVCATDRSLMLGQPPEVAGLETYAQICDYSHIVLMMSFRFIAMKRSLMKFEAFDPIAMVDVLQQDMIQGDFTETGMGLIYLTRNAESQAPESFVSPDWVNYESSQEREEHAFFAMMKCFETSPKSTVDNEFCVRSLLESSHRSHAKEWNALKKLEDQKNVLMRMTESQYDVARSQLAVSTLKKDEVRIVKRTLKQIRDEARGVTPHNCRRAVSSRRRLRSFHRSLLNRSASILASPWSIDSMRRVAREKLRVSEGFKYTASESSELSQSSVVRNRGSKVKKRTKRIRRRKWSAIKRKKPNMSADEIYEELETEDIRNCRKFLLVEDSLEGSEVEQFSEVMEVDGKANIMYIVFVDRDDGWTTFMTRQYGKKTWCFPRMKVAKMMDWNDPQWDVVRQKAIGHYLCYEGESEQSSKVMNDWFREDSATNTAKKWGKVFMNCIVEVISVTRTEFNFAFQDSRRTWREWLTPKWTYSWRKKSDSDLVRMCENSETCYILKSFTYPFSEYMDEMKLGQPSQISFFDMFSKLNLLDPEQQDKRDQKFIGVDARLRYYEAVQNAEQCWR